MNHYYPGTVKSRKYGNKISVYKDMKFDSEGEMNRYIELEMLQKAGKVRELQRQVKFDLLPKQHGRYRDEQPVSYIADFVYYNDADMFVVEDYKGQETRDYIIKRKLMLYLRGISVLQTKDVEGWENVQVRRDNKAF